MSCRTCKWLRVAPDKAGRRIPRKDKCYFCEAPLPEPALPLSVTTYHGWRWPPPRNFMSPDDGEDCPVFTPT
jgi:hypothetical protein